MKYRDISVPIHEGMPVYEGNPPVEVTRHRSIEKGDTANVSRLLMGAHTGTHVDAALHFFDNAKAIEDVPLDVLIGPARVLDLEGIHEISEEVLANASLKGHDRVLLKTANSALWKQTDFQKDFAHITGDGADALVRAGVKLVGIDYLSVEKFGAAKPAAHRALLGAGIVILEGVNLSEVQAGDYTLISLPLLIKGCEGAPCRAVLVEE